MNRMTPRISQSSAVRVCQPNLVQYVVYDKGTKIETFDWETAVEDFKRKAVAA